MFPIHIRAGEVNDDKYVTVPPGASANGVIPALCAELAAPVSGQAGVQSCINALTSQWPDMHRRQCFTNVNKTDIAMRPKLHK